jgi:hypothetical protein
VRVLCSEGNRPRYAIYVRFGQKAPAGEACKMFREEGLRPLSQRRSETRHLNARRCRLAYCVMVTLRARPWLLPDAGAAMMVTFEAPAGVVEGLPMPQPTIPAATAPVATSNRQSCKYHRFGERFRLRPIAASPAIPPGSQKTIAGRCHPVLKSRNMFSRGGDSQCNTLHRLSPSGAGEVSLVSDDFPLL